MCDNIGQAFKEVKVCPFKGEFKSGTKEFEKFLVKGQKECQRSRFEHRLTRRKNIYNIHSMKDIDMPKVVPYTFNLLKSKPKASLKKRSLQKTTANETISREEGLRKEKNNIMQTFSL